MFVQPNHDRKPLDELNAIVDEDLIDQLQRDDKDHPVGGKYRDKKDHPVGGKFRDIKDHPVGGKFTVEMIRIIKGDRLQKAK